jgi:hypothetical protein
MSRLLNIIIPLHLRCSNIHQILLQRKTILKDRCSSARIKLVFVRPDTIFHSSLLTVVLPYTCKVIQGLHPRLIAINLHGSNLSSRPSSPTYETCYKPEGYRRMAYKGTMNRHCCPRRHNLVMLWSLRTFLALRFLLPTRKIGRKAFSKFTLMLHFTRKAKGRTNLQDLSIPKCIRTK